MRILLTSESPLDDFGSGAFASDLASGLARAGHEVRCLALGRRQAGHDELPVRRIICGTDPEAHLPWDLPVFEDQPRRGLPFLEFSDEQLIQYRERVRRELDAEVSEFDPHVIHGQHVWVQGELILETGVPYVLTAHVTELRACERDDRFRPLAEQAAENAGRVITGDSRLRSRLLRLYTHVEPSSVMVIPLPVDAASFQKQQPREAVLSGLGLPESSGSVVVVMGPFEHQGGISALLNAAARIEQADTELTMAILGDSREREHFEALGQRLGLRRVHFLGQRLRTECTPLLQVADLAVTLGESDVEESFSLGAMAAGCPILASPAAEDHELLANAILTRLDGTSRSAYPDASTAAAIGQHALDSTVPQIEAIYADVLERRLSSSDAVLKFKRQQSAKPPS